MKTGKTALITGATAGFGEACAERFAREGYRLIVTGRRTERLTALQEKLKSDFGTESLALTFDVRSKAEVVAAL
ncbi:SDR family NAD(P)-dependent oxidoreductase, partial [Chitinophaga sp.]|uniref:SDR family NAD(P)-dependent oxidoreductase n=1 Tax=Chitinophaga sp. TaxID=1869181 RepID=UPI0026124712